MGKNSYREQPDKYRDDRDSDIFTMLAKIFAAVIVLLAALIALLFVLFGDESTQYAGTDSTDDAELTAEAPEDSDTVLADEITVGTTYDEEDIGESADEDTEENTDDEDTEENTDEDTEEDSEEDEELSGDYILSYSSTRLLTDEDLEDLTDTELYYARNEIFARHGRKFNNEDLQAYFDSKDWYTGIYEADEFDSSLLSSIEAQNVKIIKAEEAARD